MRKDITQLRVGLDIDGVICCFSSGVIKRAKQLGMSHYFPSSAEEVDSWEMSERFNEVMAGAWLDERFWLDLPVLKTSTSIPFDPYVYITSRRISGLVTKQWLDANGFPEAPVITVNSPSEKLEHAINLKLDLFIDDLHSTVSSMREAGLNCLLYKAPYQVGHKDECKDLPTIETLQEALDYV